MGTGWNELEYVGLNENFNNRGKRQSEQVELMRLLWQEDVLDYTGDYHRIDRASINPRPSQPVPIWFGGAAPQLIDRCARLGDGWLGGGGTQEELLGLLERVHRLRAEAGRGDAPFETATLHAVGLTKDFDEVRRLADAGLDGIVHLPFRATLGRRSTLADKRAYLERFADEVTAKLG